MFYSIVPIVNRKLKKIQCLRTIDTEIPKTVSKRQHVIYHAHLNRNKKLPYSRKSMSLKLTPICKIRVNCYKRELYVH